MKNRTTSMQDITIGVDLGDRYSRYCCIDGDGEIIEEGRLRTTPEQMRKRFESQAPSRMALEVGTHSPWVSRILKECGHEVLVANPRKLRMIYQSDRKNDRADAESLARVARMDKKLLAPIQHRGAKAQADLAVIRARDQLVHARTQLVNHVRGAVKSMGHRLPSCSTASFSRKVRGELPQELIPALDPLLELIEAITKRIDVQERHLAQRVQETYPETKRLQQVPGVGPLTSLAYVLTLEDPARFSKSRTVGAFLGLCPRQSDSGEQRPQLRITKAGDAYLRRLLVGCAQYILGPFGPDTDLRRHGQAIAERGAKSAKKRAVVAVARKLAVLLHRLWISGREYEPLRNAQKNRNVTA